MDVETFEAKIKEQEDQLFGIQLFMIGIRKTWGFDKRLIDMNERAYKSTLERGRLSIAKAKQLLEEVKQDPNKINLLDKFRFLPIRGGTFLDGMTKRAQFLVKAYEELFPNRPRETPLTEEEHNLLREKIISDF